MTRRNPNKSRTFLLLTVQEEIRKSHQNRTKINSQTCQEMEDKFGSIEICFLNPPETGYIERKISEHLVFEEEAYLIRESDTSPQSLTESDSCSSYSFESGVVLKPKTKLKKELQKPSKFFRIQQSLFCLRSLAKSRINKKKFKKLKEEKL